MEVTGSDWRAQCGQSQTGQVQISQARTNCHCFRRGDDFTAAVRSATPTQLGYGVRACACGRRRRRACAISSRGVAAVRAGGGDGDAQARRTGMHRRRWTLDMKAGGHARAGGTGENEVSVCGCAGVRVGVSRTFLSVVSIGVAPPPATVGGGRPPRRRYFGISSIRGGSSLADGGSGKDR